MFKKFIEYFTNQLQNRLNNDFEDDPGHYEKNYVKKWIILKVFYNTLI